MNEKVFSEGLNEVFIELGKYIFKWVQKAGKNGSLE